MTLAILDLTSRWTPHPEWPWVRHFNWKERVWGFATEDGQCLQIVELYSEGTPWIIAFLDLAKGVYPLILLEMVRKPDLIRQLVGHGFTLCSIKSQHPGKKWLEGMSWNRNSPMGVLVLAKYLKKASGSGRLKAKHRV